MRKVCKGAALTTCRECNISNSDVPLSNMGIVDANWLKEIGIENAGRSYAEKLVRSMLDVEKISRGDVVDLTL